MKRKRFRKLRPEQIYGKRTGYVTHRVRPMCSGYGVFPGGKKCKGCPDCGSEINRNPKTMKITRFRPIPNQQVGSKLNGREPGFIIFDDPLLSNYTDKQVVELWWNKIIYHGR